MAYIQQIRILEQKLQQLGKGPFDKENVAKTLEIQSQIRRLRRIEWEENYERIKLDDER
jgi:hypothetical protein